VLSFLEEYLAGLIFWQAQAYLNIATHNIVEHKQTSIFSRLISKCAWGYP